MEAEAEFFDRGKENRGKENDRGKEKSIGVRKRVGCNNGGGGGVFSKVKRLAAKCIGRRKQL